MTRQYNYSFEQKAKLASRKAVKEKEKEIKRLRKNLENKTIRLSCLLYTSDAADE